MKKIIVNIFILYITLQVFINNNQIHKVIIFSYEIFFENVFPNIFPFLILSGLLINYGFIDICYKLFNPLMKKLFNIGGSASFVFIMSLLTGFPSNAKYTKELYLNGQLNDLEATKILTFTHFSNPLFIIGTVGTFIGIKTAYIVLICHYIGNIIVGLIFRNYFITINTDFKSNVVKESFGTCFSNTIKNSIDTLLLIFGTMTSFLIVTSIIQNIIHLNSLNNAFFSGVLELTQGLKYVSMLTIETKIKTLLMTLFLSFGGISVHMQVLSIISNTKIKYYPFFIARLFHAIISSLMVYFIL